MRQIVAEVPKVESGKALVYRLRSTTAAMRAAEAVNGVPQFTAPYTDGQLCAWYRVNRSQLKAARERNKAGTQSPAPRNVLRDRQLVDLLDAMSRAAHALCKAVHGDHPITFNVAMDALSALDNAADELMKLREQPAAAPVKPVVSPVKPVVAPAGATDEERLASIGDAIGVDKVLDWLLARCGSDMVLNMLAARQSNAVEELVID